MNRPLVRRATVTVVLASSLALACMAGTAARADVSAVAVTCPGAAGLGTRVPVLLVHGLNSSADMWTKDGSPSMASALSSALSSEVAVSEFDYSHVHTDWVDNPEIGPALAARITCLAGASGQQGGPGKVIIVAHSMGGLAVRCAVDSVCAGKTPASPAQIGLVITLGTPNLGTFPGLVADGQWLCYSVPGCPGLLKLATTRAAGAMDPGSTLLSQLPLLPAQIPVHAFAGEITLTTSLFSAGPFAVGTHTIDNVGDVAVPVASALAEMPICTPPDPLSSNGYSCSARGLHAGPGSGTTIENCGTIPIAQLQAWQLPGTAQQLLTLPCWHLTEATSLQWQADVIAAIRGAASALTAAPLPADPNYWANRSYVVACPGIASQPFSVVVHNGQGHGASQNGSALGFDIGVGGSGGFASGDLTGDGQPEVAIVVGCHPSQTSPGFSTNEVQIFTASTSGPKMLARLIAPFPASGYPPVFGGYNPVFDISQGSLVTSVQAWAPGDCHACPSIHRTVSWQWNGQSFVPSTS